MKPVLARSLCYCAWCYYIYLWQPHENTELCFSVELVSTLCGFRFVYCRPSDMQINKSGCSCIYMPASLIGKQNKKSMLILLFLHENT